MRLIKKAVIHTETKRLSNYYTMLDGILYGNVWPHKHKTYCYIQDEIQVILRNSCASHNFTPFRSGNETYALGGMDAWKFEEKWKLIDDYNEFKKAFLSRFKTEYTRDIERFEMFKERIRKKISLAHSDGLYLFRKTVTGWQQMFDSPVITVHHPGFISALDYGKSSEFDGQPSIVFRDGLFYLYLRYNVKFKTRFIQYATSKNLIDWSSFKSIEISGYDFDEENYYMPNFFEYKNYILGLVPYFRGDVACLRLLKSTDGRKFSIENDILPSQVAMLSKNAPKNPIVPVHGMAYKKGFAFLFLHENYLGIHKKEPVEIVQYKIHTKDFENAYNL